jgi:hypothetical protein
MMVYAGPTSADNLSASWLCFRTAWSIDNGRASKNRAFGEFGGICSGYALGPIPDIMENPGLVSEPPPSAPCQHDACVRFGSRPSPYVFLAPSLGPGETRSALTNRIIFRFGWFCFQVRSRADQFMERLVGKAAQLGSSRLRFCVLSRERHAGNLMISSIRQHNYSRLEQICEG